MVMQQSIAVILLLASCVFHGGCLVFHRKGELDVVRAGPSSSRDGVDPRSAAAVQKGVTHYQAGRADKATAEFERAIALDPGNGRAHNNLGLLYFDRHQLALAASHFDQAAVLLPGDATPLNNLGMTLEAGGRVEEAIQWYRRAAEQNPHNPLYLGNLVKAKRRLGHEDDFVTQQMRDLLMIETRPTWIFWLEEQLNLDLNPLLDRGGGNVSLASDSQTPRNAPRAVSPENDDSGAASFGADKPSMTLPPPLILHDPVERLPDAVPDGAIEWESIPPGF